MNPHRLPQGVQFWTPNPFLAMRAAQRRGLKVERYYSGQYISGMIPAPGLKFFGYGVVGSDGFIPIRWYDE